MDIQKLTNLKLEIENIKHELNNDYFSNNNKDKLAGICKT